MYSLDNPLVEIFLLKWFGSGEHQFGQFRNFYPTNLKGYIDFIKVCRVDEVPAFHSIQPKLIVSKIFWEFDIKEEFENRSYNSPELDTLWEEVSKLCLNIMKRGGFPLITYSGNRGFHVWAFTNRLVFKEDDEKVAKIFYKSLVFDILGDEEEYPHFDPVPTHINALARIPFSHHQKTDNQVIPLTMERKPYLPNINLFIESQINQSYIQEQFKKAGRKLIERTKRAYDINFDKRNIRPCILDSMKVAPSHYGRLSLVVDAIYCKMSDDEIHNLFESLDSEKYDYDKTQYQISYSRDQVAEGLLPVSMKTLQGWKICTDCGICKPKAKYKHVWNDGNDSANLPE